MKSANGSSIEGRGGEAATVMPACVSTRLTVL
jgi:hypothetical protein